jgi:hypothetical protein
MPIIRGNGGARGMHVSLHKDILDEFHEDILIYEERVERDLNECSMQLPFELVLAGSA